MNNAIIGSVTVIRKNISSREFPVLGVSIPPVLNNPIIVFSERITFVTTFCIDIIKEEIKTRIIPNFKLEFGCAGGAALLGFNSVFVSIDPIFTTSFLIIITLL